MAKSTCYMCDATATSSEHVPPRCLFPERKDIDEDLRRDLITVPSCDKHNARKSKDDEFLLVSLAGIVGNNSIGYLHKFTKVNRALKRTALRLLEEAMEVKRVEWIEVERNKFIDVVWGTPDFERLNRCFDHIARGLYFHVYGKRFVGETETVLGYTSEQEHNTHEFKRLLKAKVDKELAGKERLGSNPDVFTFQFTEPDALGLLLVHLQFYGGLDIYVAFVPSGPPLPKLLEHQLIEMGIPTIIKEGGQVYAFNVESDAAEQSKATD